MLAVNLVKNTIRNLTNQPKEETMPKQKQQPLSGNLNHPPIIIERASALNITESPPISLGAAPAPETKEEKFSRLATSRLNVILKRLKTFRNLSNKNEYSYTPEQAQAIIKHLENALAKVREDFSDDKIEEVKI